MDWSSERLRQELRNVCEQYVTNSRPILGSRSYSDHLLDLNGESYALSLVMEPSYSATDAAKVLEVLSTLTSVPTLSLLTISRMRTVSSPRKADTRPPSGSGRRSSPPSTTPSPPPSACSPLPSTRTPSPSPSPGCPPSAPSRSPSSGEETAVSGSPPGP